MTRARRRLRCWLACLAIAAIAASCAPHRLAVAPLDTRTTAGRYAVALARRQAVGVAIDAEVSAWLRGDALGDLPGMHATLAVSAPDAFRLRVESMFGTALDVAARGDSLVAYIPSRRVGLRLDATGDTLGLRSPGELGVRVLSAGWIAPGAAWESASTEDSLLTLTWEELGDTLRLEIGANGLPRRVRMTRPGSGSLAASYRAWEFVDGAAWPSLVELEDLAGRFRLTLRLTRVWRNMHPAPERLVVRMPGNADRLDWPALRRALARVKGL